jgi:TusA-related sulfurtransferase
VNGDVVVVEARRTRCPVPVLRAARAARGLGPGTELLVRASDPATAIDLPAWARMRGHTVLAVEEDDDEIRVRVRLGG